MKSKDRKAQSIPNNSANCQSSTDQKKAACAPKKDDRIFDVVPNYLTVEGEDASENAKSISAREKFALALADTFDPFSFFSTGVYATISQVQHQEASWGGGAGGFARRYGSSFADMAIGNMVSMAAVPSLIHEDPRYFTLGRGRLGHLPHLLSQVGTKSKVRREQMGGTNRGRHGFQFTERVLA